MVRLPHNYQFLHVEYGDTKLLVAFLEGAGSSLNSFRYFDKRPLGVIKDHVCTLLICHDGKPVAYGHLDKEGKNVWLGIAVAEEERGTGLGKLMMDQLIEEAHVADLPKLRLSVDLENTSAIKIYERFGFHITEKQETLCFMEKDMSELDIAVSTIAFCKLPFEAGLAIAGSEELFLEFSSGMPYQDDLVQRYKDSTLRRMTHNYFPPPEEPFVLNLASANEEIRRRSIDHCKRDIELCKHAKAPFYAAHAGFCLDPDPSQLGQQITAEMKHDKGLHWDYFIASVREILAYAKEQNMPFLIENNVIIKKNLLAEGTNPLLCCEESEMNRLLREVDHELLGILLDTAHLKVSTQTLDLDLATQMEALLPIIGALHHSDNDGTVDDNSTLQDEYWFLPYMNELKNKVHVLEVKDIGIEEINRLKALLNDNVK